MKLLSKVSRRELLGGAAAATALTPFVPLLESHAADEIPTRLIVLYTCGGAIMPRWRPTGTETDWELSELLLPLAPHKNEIIILDGVDNEAAHHGPFAEGGHHSLTSLWSGQPSLLEGEDAMWSSGPTLDQFLAQQVGGATLFPSLELGVDVQEETYWKNRLSYAGAAQPVEPVGDPNLVLANIFGDPNVSAAQLQRQREARLSVLDSVAASVEALKAKTSQADNHKLDRHLSQLRAIESQVQAGFAGCDAPKLDPLAPPSEPWADYPAQTAQMMDLMVAAMACDVTRVASFMFSWANSDVRFPWLNLPDEETRWHPMSHLPNSDSFALAYQWHAEQVSALLDRLKAVPEGDGTMLDHTVVVWASPVSVCDQHISRNLPIVLAGSGGGYFETGRLYRYGNYDLASKSHDAHGGRSMNDLCLSLLHAMGLTEATTFGDPAFCTEPLL